MGTPRSAVEKWIHVIRQIEQDFSLFFAKFVLYLMIIQSSVAPVVRSSWKNHQIGQKFGKH